MENNNEERKNRPVGVWGICGFYLISLIMGSISMFAVFTGALSMTEEMQAQMDGFSKVDYILSSFMMLANFVFLILLFRLRKEALYVYGFSTVVAIVYAVYSNIAVETNIQYTQWLIQLFVLFYVLNLSKKNILKTP